MALIEEGKSILAGGSTSSEDGYPLPPWTCRAGEVVYNVAHSTASRPADHEGRDSRTARRTARIRHRREPRPAA